ncbi:MAG TPA: hypothetical protein VE973_04230 [Candidatus Limnocylindria bacterium]|nr:hypothetical protein [Candidatus Limnocylindria bacterium]
MLLFGYFQNASSVYLLLMALYVSAFVLAIFFTSWSRRARQQVIVSFTIGLFPILLSIAFGLALYASGEYYPGSGFVSRYYPDGTFEVTLSNGDRYWVNSDKVLVKTEGYAVDSWFTNRVQRPLDLYVWTDDIHHGRLTKYR